MSQALQALLAHAERERDQSRGAVLQAEDTGRRLLQQQTQLNDYRADGRQRHPATDGRSTTVDVLRHHAQFGARLEQAMQHLQGQLRNHDAQLARLRTELLAREMRLASVKKLLERRGSELQRRADRHEQRSSDDDATRRCGGQVSTLGVPWA